MTPTELRDAIATLNTNQCALARSIGVDPRTVRKWLAGENPIRTSAAMLIRVMVQNKSHNPQNNP
jgi:DNA-binding transcriptional regulator YiaG